MLVKDRMGQRVLHSIVSTVYTPSNVTAVGDSVRANVRRLDMNYYDMLTLGVVRCETWIERGCSSAFM